MPANIRIIHAHEFIKVTPEGVINLEKSKAMLIQLALASGALPDYDILLDTRQLHSGMSITDLWYLAAEMSDNIRTTYSRTNRTAILCPHECFHHAEFLAICALNRGFQVHAFTSFEDAYDWLHKNGATDHVITTAVGIHPMASEPALAQIGEVTEITPLLK